VLAALRSSLHRRTRDCNGAVPSALHACDPYGLLQSKIVKGASLKVYKGAPHGLCTTLKDQVSEDLFAFCKPEHDCFAMSPAD